MESATLRKLASAKSLRRSGTEPLSTGKRKYAQAPISAWTYYAKVSDSLQQLYLFGNQMPISRSADSGESEPWTTFSPTVNAKSPRMVPGVALETGSVPPAN